MDVAMSLLFFIALISGVCITTIGPGGIFVTIALFVLLPIDPAVVAGTASAMFIAAGIVGSLGYLRSGQLRNQAAGKAAAALSLASMAGAFAGAEINKLLDASAFAVILGIFVLLAGLLIPYRQYNGICSDKHLDLGNLRGLSWMIATGIAVGLPGGLVGVGGPVLAVPLLVVIGVPILMAVALSQVQSVFISGMATFGYSLQGAVNWSLALFLAVPLIVGTAGGWYLAQRIRANRLTIVLSLVLAVLGICLMAGGIIPG